MSAFAYHGDELFCEGVPLARIAEDVGTPVYVYSRGELERAYRAFDAALDGIPHKVCYSVKANSSLGILNVLVGLGAGADIVSIGELIRWTKAGGDPAKVVFSGVGKNAAEMRTAIQAKIGTVNIESAEEMTVLDGVARQMGTRVMVALQLKPDVARETHPYISTWLEQLTFGVGVAEARGLLGRASKM